jgi:molybdenum cofactor cytidylyltransferase
MTVETGYWLIKDLVLFSDLKKGNKIYMENKFGEKMIMENNPVDPQLVEGIILAAGYSSRTEAFKLALPVDGKPVIKHVIDAMIPICQTIYIVTGHWKDELEILLENYSKKKFRGQICLVENENYQKGMFSSVKRGVSSLKGNTFFITPGDYPLLTEDVFFMMLKVIGNIIIPQFQGRNGHPVLFKKFNKQLILDEPDSSNLKICIQKLNPVYLDTNTETVLIDLDTREDYEKILKIKG